ncbi:MAG: Rv3654c family TadE-like protein [Corynebacterium sp.]|nr:Rv3654c family TadE-like protein [Corynebacterium sp.]
MSAHTLSQRSCRRAGLAGDAGYATVTAAGVILALAALTMAIVGGASLLLTHHRAQTAADLGAVAGAYAAYYGEDGCAAAGEIVRANRATLLACVGLPGPLGDDIAITVLAGHSGARTVWSTRARTATSRAGPTNSELAAGFPGS